VGGGSGRPPRNPKSFQALRDRKEVIERGRCPLVGTDNAVQNGEGHGAAEHSRLDGGTPQYHGYPTGQWLDGHRGGARCNWAP
jgi:hypothetical protein